VPSVTSSLRVRGFAPLAASYSLNELGDNLGVVALAILVLDETGSALGTAALFLAAKFLPAFVAPACTAVLDRRPAGTVLPLLYVLEAATFGALGLVATSFSLAAILALAFCDGALALTARALSRGAVASTLRPAGRLREGNALLNVAFAVTSAAGPALAGLLVSVSGVHTVLWLDGASFLAVAALLFAARRTLPTTEVEAGEPWRERLRAGLEHVRRHPVAGRLIAGEAVALVFFTLIVPIEVVYAKETLDAGDFGFGLLLTAWGTGLVIGSWIFAKVRGHKIATLLLVSTAAVGVGYAGMAVAPTLALACVASIVGGAGNGIQWVGVMTALQESVDPEFQTRAAGLLESVFAAVPGIGFIAGGVVTALASPRVAYGIAAAGIGVVVIAWLRKPLVRDRAPA
jgi:MFS family permease